MKIDKALKKQKRSKKIFFGTMIFLAIFLPILAYLANANSIFIMVFLIIIEFLIVIAVMIKLNFYSLRFVCSNNRFRFKSGTFAKESLILCDKVAIVHTNKELEDMEIIVVTNLNFKNKKLRPITKSFMQKYPEASNEYLKLKKINPENIYYFQIIKRGALDKFVLLDNIYKNCVKSVYTASAIENIKIARGQNEIKERR